MNIRRTACCAVFLLSVALAPLLAGAPDQTGKDNAAARIAEAMDRQTQALTALLEKLPAEALPAVQDALNASVQGRNTALAALAGHSGTDTPTSDSTENSESQEGTDTTGGLTHARDAVGAAFAKSVTTLQNLIAKLPEKAVPHVQAALASVQKGQATALQTLDDLIARGISARTGSDRASVDRPGRPDRPSRPERIDRPTLPERPQRPEHPAPAGRP
jgi:hypothetical protein